MPDPDIEEALRRILGGGTHEQPPSAPPEPTPTPNPDLQRALEGIIGGGGSPGAPTAVAERPTEVPREPTPSDPVIEDPGLLSFEKLIAPGLEKLDWLDKRSLNIAAQPWTEILNLRSWYPSAEANVPASVRDVQLARLYQEFEAQHGRPPGFLDKLDIQSDTSPVVSEIAGDAAVLAPIDVAAGGIGTLGKMAGTQLARRGAQQGGKLGRAQQLAGQGLERNPLYYIDRAQEAAIRGVGQGIAAGARALRRTPQEVADPVTGEIVSLATIPDQGVLGRTYLTPEQRREIIRQQQFPQTERLALPSGEARFAVTPGGQATPVDYIQDPVTGQRVAIPRTGDVPDPVTGEIVSLATIPDQGVLGRTYLTPEQRREIIRQQQFPQTERLALPSGEARFAVTPGGQATPVDYIQDPVTGQRVAIPRTGDVPDPVTGEAIPPPEAPTQPPTSPTQPPTSPSLEPEAPSSVVDAEPSYDLNTRQGLLAWYRQQSGDVRDPDRIRSEGDVFDERASRHGKKIAILRSQLGSEDLGVLDDALEVFPRQIIDGDEVSDYTVEELIKALDDYDLDLREAGDSRRTLADSIELEQLEKAVQAKQQLESTQQASPSVEVEPEITTEVLPAPERLVTGGPATAKLPNQPTYEFATEQNLEMPMGEGRVEPTSLVDEEQIAARQERRDAINRGQQELGGIAEERASYEASRAEISQTVVRLGQETRARERMLDIAEEQADDLGTKQAIANTKADLKKTNEITQRISDIGSDKGPPGTTVSAAMPFEHLRNAMTPQFNKRAQRYAQREFEGEQNRHTIHLLEWWGKLDEVYKEIGRQPNSFSVTENDAILNVLHGEAPWTSLDQDMQYFAWRVKELQSETEIRKIRFLKDALESGSYEVLSYSPSTMLLKMAKLSDDWLDQVLQRNIANLGRSLPAGGQRDEALMSSPDALKEFTDMVTNRVRDVSHFPRYWRLAQEDATLPSGRGVRRPSSTYDRTENMTYDEMREKGLLPQHHDPALMAMQDAFESEAHANIITWMGKLKEMGLLKRENTVIRDPGWRVPRVGRPFEGVLLEDGTKTPSWAAMRYDAEFIERILNYRGELNVTFAEQLPLIGGKTANLTVEALKVTDWTKFGRFFLSGYQAVDMSLRAAREFASPVGGIRRGGIRGLPETTATTFRMIASSSDSRKMNLYKRALDKEPITESRPKITMEYLVAHGLSVSGDRSAFVRSMTENSDEMIERIIRASGDSNVLRRTLKNGQVATDWIKSGLFDVFYTNFLLSVAKHVEVPRIVGAYPDWSDEQIASAVADSLNRKFSSYGHYDPLPLLTGPNAEVIARATALSVNETRGWFGIIQRLLPSKVSLPGGRSTRLGGLLPEDNAPIAYWDPILTHVALLALTANIFNFYATAKDKRPWTSEFWSTGKPITPSQYSPVRTTREGEGMPIEYNPEFLLPINPFVTGRGDRLIYTDLVAQLDTPARFLDFGSAVMNRTSVHIRPIINQMKGSNFYGEPLDSLSKRATQLALDFMPVPFESLIQAGRSKGFGEGIVPPTEERLGASGKALQGWGGFNLRAETNAQLRNRFTREMGFGENYLDLEPYLKQIVTTRIDAETENELLVGAEESARRGDPYSQYVVRKRELDAEQQEEYEKLVERIWSRPNRKERRSITNDYFDTNSRFHWQRSENARELDFDDDEESLLDRFYDTPFERREAFMQSLDQADRQFIFRNTNLRPIPQALLDFLRKNERKSWDRIRASQIARQTNLRGIGQ